MKRILLLPLLVLTIKVASAQNNYAVSSISKELLSYASAVVRNQEVTIEVKEPDNVWYHIKTVVTVLNKNGDDYADLIINYDKIRTIKSIKGLIYNEYGKVIQKISERDFSDVAISDGASIFNDDRAKHYTRAITEYPYTIEFEYEVKSKQSLDFPDWVPEYGIGLSVEKSSYTFICKPDYNIRYNEINLPAKVNVSTNYDGRKIYNWQVSNLKAKRYEPMSPDWRNTAIRVMISPEKFAYDNYSGSFNNWQQLGKWVYDNIVKDREELPYQTVQYIKDLTASISDPKLKAKKIYEYMQQKTHYISVQVGIGGYQPFLASDVDKDGYGDCKALVNYTKALLKSVGIDSYYCLVYGESQKLSMIPDFASMQGNHIILCVPFKNDTTWLECTNQHIPFGFLGDFTDDRIVLACTADGGKLMHTPKYTTEENLEKHNADFILTETGELNGNITSEFRGVDYEDRESIIDESQPDRVKNIKRYYPINNLNISTLEYKQDKNIKPATFENIKLSAREYGAATNGKLYFSLNSVDRYTDDVIPNRVINRQNPVYINRGYTEEDQITYTLPKDYKLDSEPLNISIEKPFGIYSATMTINGDQLIYKRKFQIKDGLYSKDIYHDVVDFYQSVVDADNYNVTMVKK